jgi:hypothetical protein
MSDANVVAADDAKIAVQALEAVASRLNLRGAGDTSEALRRVAKAIERGGVVHVLAQAGSA